jgi:hypothetical protein
MDNNYNNDPNNLGGQNNDPYGQNSGYSNAQQNDPYGQNSGYSNAQQNAPYGQNGGYGSAPQNNQYGQNGYNDPYGQNPYNSAPDFYSNVNQGFGEDNSGKATASMVCGIISLILWCIPHRRSCPFYRSYHSRKQVQGFHQRRQSKGRQRNGIYRSDNICNQLDLRNRPEIILTISRHIKATLVQKVYG